ncbi:LPS export ABC transporter periplasmic protein LptC [Sediminispirochaeta smaragdinae]|uniref:LPS export ABC transporter periplasmic protein LptC n=1 Tax=Sediminispirochaeta smaragdinae (strain DSM 11293 / JCM 15392 / SEBR 4228) TaxID=573413 RepID=E1R9F8_SEDSS|nr:LPS export ABC transporter periplasmic protein LptC [Sediminispirochaeta smaragdinae]ADK83127.1 protein of unknown function DUF1239 [Sediminispirochaeta smaragdinae DSM 11293]
MRKLKRNKQSLCIKGRRLLLPGFFHVSALLFIVWIVAACSVDYEKAKMAEDLGEETPETVMHGFRQANVIGHHIVYEIEATQVESYPRQKVLKLSDVDFREFDQNGDQVFLSTAGSMEYDLREKRIDLGSGVKILRTNENGSTEIEGDAFSFDEKEKLITAPPTSLVRFSDEESGGVLAGRGFSAETDSGTIQFSGGVSGTYGEDTHEP